MPAERDSPPPPEPDEFDRMLIELTSGQAGPARYRELSAAERASKAAAIQARRAVAARREVRIRRRRRLLLWTTRTTSVLLVLALVGYGVYTFEFRTSPAGSPSTGLSSAGPGQTPSNSPVPGTHDISPAFTATDPFFRSPAEKFADNAAGVIVPAAHPVHGYTTAQVAAAFASTRRLLIAAGLDPQTLHGGRPRAFIRLLTPQQRATFLRGLDRPGVDKLGAARSTRAWLVSFASGTAFVGTVIKVHGHMSAVAASESGRPVLRVRFNFLFVYPVQRPGQPQTRLRVVAHARGNVDFAQWSTSGGPLQPWWLGTGISAANDRCDIADGFVHPEFPGGVPDKVSPSGRPVNPYDLNPPATHAKCQATAGT